MAISEPRRSTGLLQRRSRHFKTCKPLNRGSPVWITEREIGGHGGTEGPRREEQDGLGDRMLMLLSTPYERSPCVCALRVEVAVRRADSLPPHLDGCLSIPLLFCSGGCLKRTVRLAEGKALESARRGFEVVLEDATRSTGSAAEAPGLSLKRKKAESHASHRSRMNEAPGTGGV